MSLPIYETACKATTKCHPAKISMSQISQRSLLRFLLVGGSATMMHYAIMGCLINFMTTTISIASAIGYMLSAFYNYWANAHFSFGGNHRHTRSLPRFFSTALAGLAINHFVLLAGISFNQQLFTAQLIATVAVLTWNYIVNATWTFARRDDQL